MTSLKRTFSPGHSVTSAPPRQARHGFPPHHTAISGDTFPGAADHNRPKRYVNKKQLKHFAGAIGMTKEAEARTPEGDACLRGARPVIHKQDKEAEVSDATGQSLSHRSMPGFSGVQGPTYDLSSAGDRSLLPHERTTVPTPGS